MPVKGVIKPGPMVQAGGGAAAAGVSGPVTGSYAGPAPSTSTMQARECGSMAEEGVLLRTIRMYIRMHTHRDFCLLAKTAFVLFMITYVCAYNVR